MTLPLLPRDVAGYLPPEEVPDSVKEIQIEIYLECFLVTLVIYDSLCTMDKEVKYFWAGRSWNATKFVYFLNRYGGIFGAFVDFLGLIWNPSQVDCDVSIWSQSISWWITVISIDYVLMVRVLAFYQNNKKMSLFLGTLLALEAVAKFAIVVVGQKESHIVVVGVASGLANCAIFGFPNPALYIIDWTLPLAYGTLLLCLVLFKATSYWREHGLHGSRLIFVLIKDQALYFALAIFCSLFEILDDVLALPSPVLGAVFAGLGSPTILCILGSRMFFNLKEAAEHGVNVGTNWSSYSHSAIHFDEPQSGQHEGSGVSAIVFNEAPTETVDLAGGSGENATASAVDPSSSA